MSTMLQFIVVVELSTGNKGDEAVQEGRMMGSNKRRTRVSKQRRKRRVGRGKDKTRKEGEEQMKEERETKRS